MIDINQLKLELIQQILHTQDKVILQHFREQLQQAKVATINSSNQDLLNVLLQKKAEPNLSQEDIQDIQRSISDIFEGQ